MSDGINVESLITLADRLRSKPGQTLERIELVVSCDGLPWLAHVPAPTETCIKILAESDPKTRAMPCELGSSSMEVPSALATFRRWWPGAVIAMGDPGQPDPRKPLKPGIAQWRFDGVHASPALDPPSTAGSAAIAPDHWRIRGAAGVHNPRDADDNPSPCGGADRRIPGMARQRQRRVRRITCATAAEKIAVGQASSPLSHTTWRCSSARGRRLWCV